MCLWGAIKLYKQFLDLHIIAELSEYILSDAFGCSFISLVVRCAYIS